MSKINLWIVCAFLVLIWEAGVVSSYTYGGFIHVLLFPAVIFFISGILTERKVTKKLSIQLVKVEKG